MFGEQKLEIVFVADKQTSCSEETISGRDKLKTQTSCFLYLYKHIILGGGGEIIYKIILSAVLKTSIHKKRSFLLFQ